LLGLINSLVEEGADITRDKKVTLEEEADWLGVFSTNRRAIHVYEKLGFRETGRVPNEIYKGVEYIDHITMTKVI
jgi:ribosomal protein S18 acetylase RimI-like enzyme